MTTTASPANPRIELARTRRMLEDTALAVVPGTLLRLTADHGSDHRWTATVRTSAGDSVLRLDRLLQTVEVVPPGQLAAAA